MRFALHLEEGWYLTAASDRPARRAGVSPPSGNESPQSATISPMDTETETSQHLRHAAVAAREASRVLAGTSEERRNIALRIMATSLRDHRPEILAANAADLAAYNGSNAFRDRLTLSDTRVEAMARGLEDVAALPDPRPRPGGLDAAERAAHSNGSPHRSA